MQRKLLYGLLLLAGIGLTYVGLKLFERVEEPVYHGWSPAAMRNPFLAAERFLQSQGVEARRADRADTLDSLSVDATLLIQNVSLMSNEKFAGKLEAWLKAGGHAIVEAPSYEDEAEYFFGVYKYRAEDETASDSKSRSESLDQLRDELLRELRRELEIRRGSLTVDELLRRIESEVDPADLTHLHFSDDGGYQLLIHFPGDELLYHHALYDEDDDPSSPLYYWTGNEHGPTFMQLAVGDGLLSVVSSIGIWRSEGIGRFDHAHLLRELIGFSDEVVFLSSVEMPNLLEMLWANFREILLITLLCLLAWIIYRGRRFGPVLVTETEGRRSFHEHLQAVGRFMWQHKQSEQLLVAVRNDIWQLLQRRYQIRDNMPDAQKLAPLVQLAGLDYSQVQHLMYGPAPDDELQFLTMVKSLQEIRKAL